MQLYGGCASSSVRSLLDPELASWYSVFECDVVLPDRVSEDTVCSILDNILSRGKPTLCSLYVEQVLADRLELTQESTTTRSIRFKLAEQPDDELKRLIRQALVCIEPRIQHSKVQFTYCDSDEEREFLREVLPDTVGAYAVQLLDAQRPLGSIIDSDRFKEQRVDFACEFPVKGKGIRGLVIEIDGSQHDEEPQVTLDTQRDEAVRAVGWQTVRIKTRELSHIPADKIAQLRGFFQDKYAQVASENYQNPLWKNEYMRSVYQLVLVPFAVTRIQKTLVQLIRSGVLSLHASEWKIAVLERDIPCASLAVDDFLQLLRSLLTLQGRDFTPKVELRAYCSEEFAASERGKSISSLPFEYKREIAGFRAGRAVKTFNADAFLDIAMLQHSGLTTIEPALRERVAPNAVTAVIRSVQHIDATRRVASAEPIAYQLVDSEDKREALRYFLQYLFRKEEFREGQVGILKRALARQDVIGLLPTGAGKSLCYQLSALLQPGITLVIDPIKSLMHDQDDHLKEAGIDTTTFIDSSLKKGERLRRIKRFQDGEFQFAFVSPERLMIREFRNALTKMGTGADPKWFAYCVIDEAHCVSEWGHDFRTAYLRLGENARRFCKPALGHLPFIALTGTASFDVLSDVQRELQLEDDQAIITLESYQRKELHFEIIRVPEPPDLPANKKTAWTPHARQKNFYLANWLKKLPQQFGYHSSEYSDFYKCNREQTNSGLVFCPHVNNVFGIHEVSAYLKENLPHIAESIGKYAGELDPVDLGETQCGFRNNDLALLVATKSFGMGIDKPNIRYTLHFNMPLSLEAFYQEAGRAGRDRQEAVCALLFSEEFSDKGLMQSFIKNAFRGEEQEKTIIYELLNWIETSDGSRPGIERILEKMVIGQTRKVIIPFENERIKKIARDTRNPLKKVQNICKFRHTIEEFAWKLGVRVNERLTNDFRHIRTESETFKAIYRLSAVGAIEDYTIDYNKNLIEAMITKCADDEYIETLSQYVSRYMSQEEAKRVPEKIIQRNGKTVLQKCLGYLISFVYDRIKKRREEALDVMEQAAKVGVYPNYNPGKDRDACRRDFSDVVYSYFDSRYTPKLRNSLYSYDLDLVWQYIDKVNGEPGLTKHLRGSCDRLLVENPDNAAFLLLRAYAQILLTYSEEDVLSDLQRGFGLFKNQLGHSATVEAASQFYRKIEKQGDRMLPAIRGQMIKLHLEWLKKFNQKLEGK